MSYFRVNYGVCNHCNTVVEAMAYPYHYCLSQEERPSLSDADIERGVKRREEDEVRTDYIRQNGYKIVEMCGCECWSLY